MALRLLVSSRGVATAYTPDSRYPGHHGASGGSPQFQSLKFENCLPINLRCFLTAELGQRLCIDDSTIAPSSGEGPDAFMRDLARAIRRFSFARAHESWIEALASRCALEDCLMRARADECHAVVCLRCACLNVGPDALGEHREASCLAVPLHGFCAGGQEQIPASTQFRRNLYGEIESFRQARAALRLPHFDLDYYLREGFYVFTWRPLPSG
jgi:hypothetical protein